MVQKPVAVFAIFLLSLFASAFPTLSRRLAQLRIPSILFFILKHFGTGVILSTAFVHLLQDAFEILLEFPSTTPIRRWVGLIVLAALLAIFMVEYISMAYLEKHEEVGDTHDHENHEHNHHHHHHHDGSSQSTLQSKQGLSGSVVCPRNFGSTEETEETSQNDATEHSRLLNASRSFRPLSQQPPSIPHPLSCNASHGHAYGSTSTSVSVDSPEPFFTGHHRFELAGSHASHPPARPRLRDPSEALSYSVENPTGPDIHKLCIDTESFITERSVELDGLDEEQTREAKIGEKRAVLNTLVLQAGIMVHSLVIGLTLSIQTGAEFTSLLIALAFHQLFEGLSLGVRLAALASPSTTPHHASSPISPTLSTKSVHLKNTRNTVKALSLAALFAAAVPIGVLIGTLTLGRSGLDPTKSPTLRLAQGVTAAASGGTLIYAACIELLAGDFVQDASLKRAPIMRQALALGSLLAGVAAMATLAAFD